eukprot:m.293438 g.293438  ORF g.293438 m.293438 type:complete len:3737 (+) comp23439_c0_seq1:79-11289(+)
MKLTADIVFLIALLSACEATTPLQDACNQFFVRSEAFPVSPSIESTQLWDLNWAERACSVSPPTDYTSNVTDLVLIGHPSVRTKEFTATYNFSIVQDERGFFNVHITINGGIQSEGQVSPSATLNSTSLLNISIMASFVPKSSIVPAVSGSIMPLLSETVLHVRDPDIFDPAPAVVASLQPLPEVPAMFKSTLSAVLDLQSLASSFDTSTTSHFESLRRIVPSSLGLSGLVVFQVAQLYTPQTNFTGGLYFESSDANDSDALVSLAEGAKRFFNRNFAVPLSVELVQSQLTIQGYLSTEPFGLLPLGGRFESTALATAENGGLTLRFGLNVAGPTRIWYHSPYAPLTDLASIFRLLQSTTIVPHGSIGGWYRNHEQLYTVSKGDLFGHRAAGVAFQDQSASITGQFLDNLTQHLLATVAEYDDAVGFATKACTDVLAPLKNYNCSAYIGARDCLMDALETLVPYVEVYDCTAFDDDRSLLSITLPIHGIVLAASDIMTRANAQFAQQQLRTFDNATVSARITLKALMSIRQNQLLVDVESKACNGYLQFRDSFRTALMTLNDTINYYSYGEALWTPYGVVRSPIPKPSSASLDHALAVLNLGVVDIDLAQAGTSSWNQILAAWPSSTTIYDFLSFLWHAMDAARATNSILLIEFTSQVQMRFTLDTVVAAKLQPRDLPWTGIVDTTRLAFPVHYQLSLVIESGSVSSTIRGSSSWSWVLPVHLQFLKGVTLNGTCELELGSSPRIALIGAVNTDRGEIAHISFGVQDLGLGSERAYFNADNPSDISISPPRLLQLLGTHLHLPARLYNGALDVTMPLSAETLGRLNNLNPVVDDLMMLFAAPDTFNPIYARAGMPSGLTTCRVIVSLGSVEKPVINTSISFASSLETIVLELNQAAEEAEVADLILFSQVAYQLDTPPQIQVTPAMQGRTTQVSVSTSDTRFGLTGSYDPSGYQTMACGFWDELVALVEAKLHTGLDHLHVNETTIPISSIPGLANPRLSAVYPANAPALKFPALFSVKQDSTASKPDMSLSAANLPIAVSAINGSLATDLSASASADLYWVFDVPPSGNLVITSRDHVLSSQTNVTLHLEGFLRSETARTREVYSVPLTFSGNQSLCNAFQKDLYDALPPLLQRIVSVNKDGFRNAKNSTVLLLASPLRFDNGTWFVPDTFGLADISPDDSKLNHTLLRLPRNRLVIGNMSIVGHAGAEGRLDLLDLNMGFIGGEAGPARSSFDFDARIQSLHPFMLVGDLSSALRNSSTFSQAFGASMSLGAALVADNIQLEVDHFPLLTKDSELSLSINNSVTIDANTTIDDMVHGWQYNASFNGSFAYMKLMNEILSVNLSTPCSTLEGLEALALRLSENPAAAGAIPFGEATIQRLLKPIVSKPVQTAIAIGCAPGHQMTMTVMCDVLQRAFHSDSPVCQTSIISEDSYQLDLAFLMQNTSTSSQINLDFPRFLQSSKIPSASGLHTSLSLDLAARLSLSISVNFTGAGLPTFHILEGTLQVTLASQLVSEMSLWLGPLEIALGQIDGQIGNPVTAVVEYRPDQLAGIDFSLTGEASLRAVLNLGGKACDMMIAIPDILDFLEGYPNASTISSRTCDLEQGIIGLLENAGFVQILLRYGRFETQLIESVARMLLHLVGADNLLHKLNVPLLKNQWVIDLMDILLALFEPRSWKKLFSSIQTSILAIEHQMVNGDIPFEKAEQLALNAFTSALCKVLNPVTCPTPPTAGVYPYSWPLHFRHVVTKPIADLHLDYGAHGFASVEANCSEELEYGYELRFALVYDRKDVSIQFQEALPSFNVSAHLDLDSCHLDTTLLLLGLELEAKGHVSVDAAVFASEGSSQPGELQASFDVDIRGDALLGFAGLIAKLMHLTDDQSLHGFPNVQAGFEMTYDCGTDGCNTSPVVSFTNATICAGQFLVKALAPLQRLLDSSFAQELYRVVDFLESDNPLCSVMTGTSMDQAHCLQAVATSICGDCDFKNVFEFLDAMEMFVAIAHDLEDMIQELGNEKCGDVRQAISNFAINFTRDTLTPPDVPSQPINITGPDTPRRATTESYFNKLVSGKFVISSPMIQHFVSFLFKALTDPKDAFVLTMELPGLLIKAGVTWEIPAFPFIDVYLTLQGELQLTPPKVGLSLDALVKAFESKRLSNVLKGMSLSTSKFFLGKIKIGAGAALNLFFLKAGVGISATMSLAFEFYDPANTGWTTVAELQYLMCIQGGSLLKALKREAIAVFALDAWAQVCYPVPFHMKCKTFYSQSWDLATFDDTHTPPTFPPVLLSNELVDLSAFVKDFECKVGSSGELSPAPGLKGGKPLLKLTQHQRSSGCTIGADFIKDGYQDSIPPHAGTLDCDAGQYIDVGRGAYNSPIQLEILGVDRGVSPPASTAIVLSMESYSSASNFFVSNQAVAAEGSVGVKVSDCATITLANPKEFSSIHVRGTGCPVYINATKTMAISIDGLASSFANPDVYVRGEVNNITWQANATQLDISSTRLSGDNGLVVVHTPQLVRSTTVYAHPEHSTNFTIANVTAASQLWLGGGNKSSQFIVDLNTIDGSVTLQGAIPGKLNSIVLLNHNSESSSRMLVSDTAISLNSSNGFKYLSALHIQIMKLELTASPNGTAELDIVSTAPFGFYSVDSTGAPGASVVVRSNGCQGGSVIEMKAKGGGDQQLVIGALGSISSYTSCTVRVIGDTFKDENDTLIIDASAQSEPFLVTWKQGLADFAAIDGSFLFTVVMQDLNQVILRINPACQKLHIRGTSHDLLIVGTDTLPNSSSLHQGIIKYPLIMMATPGLATGIVAHGAFDYVFGEYDYPIISPAFSLMLSNMAIISTAPAARASQLSIFEGTTSKYPLQLLVDSHCATNANGSTPLPVAFPASPWLQAQAYGRGIPAAVSFNACNVPYSGAYAFSTIATDLADVLTMIQPNLTSVDVTLNAGNDTFKLDGLPLLVALANVTIEGSTDSNDISVNCRVQPCSLSIKLAEGHDNVTVYAPIERGVVDVGSGSMDNVWMYYGPFYPQLLEESHLTGLSTSPGSDLILQSLGEFDTLNVLQGNMADFVDLNVSVPNPELLNLAWTTPFATLRWQLLNDTNVQLEKLGVDSRVGYVVDIGHDITLNTKTGASSYTVESIDGQALSIAVPNDAQLVFRGACSALQEIVFTGRDTQLAYTAINTSMAKPWPPSRSFTLHDNNISLVAKESLDVFWLSRFYTIAISTTDGVNQLDVQTNIPVIDLYPGANSRLDVTMRLSNNIILPGHSLQWSQRRQSVQAARSVTGLGGCLRPKYDCSRNMYQKRAIEHSELCRVSQSRCEDEPFNVKVHWEREMGCTVDHNSTQLTFSALAPAASKTSFNRHLIIPALLHYGLGFSVLVVSLTVASSPWTSMFFGTYSTSLLVDLHTPNEMGPWSDAGFDFLEGMYVSNVNYISGRSNDCASDEEMHSQDSQLESLFGLQVGLALGCNVIGLAALILLPSVMKKVGLRKILLGILLLANAICCYLFPLWIIPVSMNESDAGYAVGSFLVSLLSFAALATVRAILKESAVCEDKEDFTFAEVTRSFQVTWCTPKQRRFYLGCEFFVLIALMVLAASEKTGTLRVWVFVCGWVAFTVATSLNLYTQIRDDDACDTTQQRRKYRLVAVGLLTLQLLLFWSLFFVALGQPGSSDGIFACLTLGLLSAVLQHWCAVLLGRSNEQVPVLHCGQEVRYGHLSPDRANESQSLLGSSRNLSLQGSNQPEAPWIVQV